MIDMEYPTQKLYLSDSFIEKFSATVLACLPVADGFDIVLDQTAFFPEGGGQAGDMGKIGDVCVCDTKIVGKTILHRTDAPLPVGSEVVCTLDWDSRFDRMQNHSAEHILSGVAHRRYGCTNVGFHLGDAVMTVDFDKKLSLDEIKDIEYLSNKAVFDNLAITAVFPREDELKDLSYRSKIEIEDELRLVGIDTVDLCACCAPHVKFTGQIGMIKILDFCPNKGGTRITAVAGHRALSDYQMIHEATKEMMKMYSSPRDGVVFAAKKQADNTAAVLKENAALKRELSLYKAEIKSVGENAVVFCRDASFDDLRYCSNHFIEQGAHAVVALSEGEPDAFLYVVNTPNGNGKSVVQALNSVFGGKGGGNGSFAQGKLVGKKTDILSETEKLLCDI